MMNSRHLDATGSTALLAAHRLDICLGDRRLVQGLDLDILPGQRWCVLGPNGSGKTTLLQTLAGLRSPDHGEVLVDGSSYAHLGARRAAQQRALLAQGQHFAFRMSVRDCAMLGRHPHVGRFGWPGAAEWRRVEAALATMDLLSLATRDVLSLSGGEQQRAHIAMLLVQAPALFLLDEPTTHLDLKHQAALFAHLCELCKRERRAVMFSTHELGVAAAFATHALLLCGDGKFRQGRCEDLLDPEILGTVFGFPLAALEMSSGRRAFVPQW